MTCPAMLHNPRTVRSTLITSISRVVASDRSAALNPTVRALSTIASIVTSDRLRCQPLSVGGGGGGPGGPRHTKRANSGSSTATRTIAVPTPHAIASIAMHLCVTGCEHAHLMVVVDPSAHLWLYAPSRKHYAVSSE